MRDCIIESDNGKGRAFRAVLLASIEADPLWPGGQTSTDALRPIWAMFAGSDAELRAFMANLRCGRKATFPKRSSYYRKKQDVLETLKTAGYQVTWQRETEGTLATIFLPDLFRVDPGMVDPAGVNFVLTPTFQWVDSQNIDVYPLMRYVESLGYSDLHREWAVLAFLFAAYLDRRTHCPLIADGRFYFQLLLSSLKQGLASFSTSPDAYSYREYGFGAHCGMGYHEQGIESVGLHPGLAFQASHEQLDQLLAQEVDLYFSMGDTKWRG